MSVKVFSDHLYRNRIHFVLKESDDFVLNYVKKKHHKNKVYKSVRESIKNSQGFVYWLGEEDILMVSKDLESGTIYHEMFHLVCHIFRKAGIALCEESEETYSYYFGYLSEELSFFLKKDKST